ncbi:MAG: DUF4387 domain-containing protein [bacterium]|nr:DUF4387 domain-containing protein [bacterium]
MATLRDLAKTLRSKNCDPFNTTFDVFFDDAETYQRVKESGAINATDIAALYGLEPAGVLGIYFLDGPMAFKVTIVKDIPSSDPDCKDVFGAHQHLQLSNITIPEGSSQ